MEIKLRITKRQSEFIKASADEVLFGGAAGGGKSYGQLIDALLYALKYPGSKQLLLRRTYPDLERSLVLEHLKLYPKKVYSYNSSTHRGRFVNGSTVEFGYCDNEKDVYRYQGAEYDTIRFDELTHFTESQYIYLISRLRGVNDYPKQVKSSTNPGGVGHVWVKQRFIDPAPPNTEFRSGHTSRIFLPSRVQDNHFLMDADPEYIERLKAMGEREVRALLYGDWDLTEGRFFPEWDEAVHVKRGFEIPKHWRRYLTMDYGMDMLAAYCIAVDEQGRGFVYRELYQPGLIISAAAQAVKTLCDGEHMTAYLAPPDLWNSRQETGKSVADWFADYGIMLTKTSNRRVDGWMAVREWLAVQKNEFDERQARLTIFEHCRNLIRTLPQLQPDEKKPEDVANEPHELTHAPDALRGFCVYWTTASGKAPGKKSKYTDDMLEDYRNASKAEKKILIERWGEPSNA